MFREDGRPSNLALFVNGATYGIFLYVIMPSHILSTLYFLAISVVIIMALVFWLGVKKLNSRFRRWEQFTNFVRLVLKHTGLKTTFQGGQFIIKVKWFDLLGWEPKHRTLWYSLYNFFRFWATVVIIILLCVYADMLFYPPALTQADIAFVDFVLDPKTWDSLVFNLQELDYLDLPLVRTY